MKINRPTVGNKSKAVYVFMALAFSLQFLTGCAAHSQTYKETTTTASAPADTTAQPTATTSTTTVEKSSSASSSPHSGGGIIGGVFHVIGQVLAFPFKLVGSIIEAIF